MCAYVKSGGSMSYFVVGLVAITYEPTQTCHLSLFRNFGSVHLRRWRATARSRWRILHNNRNKRKANKWGQRQSSRQRGGSGIIEAGVDCSSITDERLNLRQRLSRNKLARSQILGAAVLHHPGLVQQLTGELWASATGRSASLPTAHYDLRSGHK